MDVVVSAVAAVVSALVGAYIGASIQYRHTRKNGFDDKIANLLKMVMDHPELESKDLCRKWATVTEQERDQPEFVRYDHYCIQVFNLMRQIHTFCNGDDKRIAEILDFHEYISDHKAWWRSESENNYRVYGDGFYAYINKLEMRRPGRP